MRAAPLDDASGLTESGLDLDIVAATLRIVHCRIATGRDPEEGEEPGEGWMAVARRAAVMFAEAADEDQGCTFRQFGDLLRVAFARAADPDFQGPAFDEIAPKSQVAWEYTARHAANVFNADETEARRLGQHEDRISQMGLARLASLT